MKKLYILLFASLAFLTASCGDANDTYACYMRVQREYPKATVQAIPGKQFRFIVVDTCGAVHYVETMALTSSEVTSKFTVAPCR